MEFRAGGLGATVALMLLLAGCSSLSGPRTFKVTIANVTDRSEVTTVISTGVAFTHNKKIRMFEAGVADKGWGLEGIAEDGNKWGLVAYLKKRREVFDQLIFDVPAGGTKPLNIGPGKRYEFYISASPRHPYLSLSTMVGFTNDLFFALDSHGVSGLSLFHPDGTAKTDEELREDVRAAWDVWDAGTEVNELNGAGPNQPDAPTGLNVGPEDRGLVQIYEDVRYPVDRVSDAVTVRVTAKAGAPEGTYVVTLTNTTDRPGLTPSAFAPLLAVAHGPSLSLFDQGLPDRGHGLEALAEDGDASGLIGYLRRHPDYLGHAVGGAPIPPGGSGAVEIQLDADHPHLSIAAMYVESNDVFVSFLNPFGYSGVELFGKADAAIARATEGRLQFMESGTEKNEEIGEGDHQAARQEAPGQGEIEQGTVRRYRIPSDPIVVGDIATITITRADDVTRFVIRRNFGQGTY